MLFRWIFNKTMLANGYYLNDNYDNTNGIRYNEFHFLLPQNHTSDSRLCVQWPSALHKRLNIFHYAVSTISGKSVFLYRNSNAIYILCANTLPSIRHSHKAVVLKFIFKWMLLLPFHVGWFIISVSIYVSIIWLPYTHANLPRCISQKTTATIFVCIFMTNILS